jgi:3-hydroxyisobutyrate dehydrogenase-like beta-hydroxyacid dehydrogenase
MKIGFVGLGQMGRGMAGRLLGAGHVLMVHNRSAAAVEALRAQGAAAAASVLELAGCEIVVSMLADDAAVQAACIDSGLVAAMPRGTLHLNMASVSLALAQRLTELHRAAGSEYVSAPVFGRPAAAAQGQIEIIAGGPPAALRRCAPLFAVMGRHTCVVGDEPHKANVVKIARNYMLAAAVQSMSEAFALVRKSGVDVRTFFELVTANSFSGGSHRNYGRLMVERQFEQAAFTLKLGLKDIDLALAAGGATGVPLPLAEAMREQHLGALACGLGDKDWAVMADYMAGRAGL